MRALLRVLVLLCAAPAGAAEVRRFGLFVGNDLGRPDDAVLRYAQTDAHRVRDGFIDIGGFRPEDTVLLVGSVARDVRRAAADLAERAERASAGGVEAMLLFYYSGHADGATLHLGGSDLGMAEIKALLDASGAKVRLAIIDACRSGGFSRLKGGTPAPPFDLSLEGGLEGQGHVTLTSSAADEDSQESDRLGGSYFTHHLVSGLRGAADASKDGKVTLAELYRYVYHQTLRSTRGTRAPQHPSYRYDIEGRGDLVLSRLLSPDRLGWLRVVAAGPYLVTREDTGDVVAELVAGDAGGVIALRPGAYRVTRRDRDALLETVVGVEIGGEVVVRPADMERLAYARLVRKGGPEAASTAHALFAAGGVQGPLPGIAGSMPLVQVGYRLDLRWLTLRPLLVLGRGQGRTPTLSYELSQVGAALQVLHVVDVASASFGAGLSAAALRFDQSFGGVEPDRAAWGLGLSAVAVAEIELLRGVSLHASGEVGTETFPLSEELMAPALSSELHSLLTWRVLAGLGVAF